MEIKKLTDGTYLIAPDGVNVNTNHLHISSDGKVLLSYRVNNQHQFKRSDVRKGLSELWEEITGEKHKFPLLWKPED